MNRRAEVVEFGETLVMTEKEIPEAPPGGLIIKTQFCGICHSDVHIWEKHLSPKQQAPIVLGHEISGSVHTVSKEALEANPELVVGSNVVVFPWIGCNNCPTCDSGNIHCPYAMGFNITRLSANMGFSNDGGFQEYVVLQSARQAVPVKGDVPMDVAALCACSGVTGYNAARSVRESVEAAIKSRGQATILQVGAGGLSLWALQVNRALYGEKVKIVVLDINEDKLADAKAAGADVTAVWDPSAAVEIGIGTVRQALGGFADGIIDFTGLTATAERVFYCLNPGATWAIVGIFGGTMPPLPLKAATLFSIRIQGVYVGTKEHMAEMIELVQQGKVRPPPIEHIDIEAANATLLKVKEGKQKGRAVIKF